VVPSPDPDTLRIVVAEDDPDDRLLLTDALQASGLDAELLFLDDGEQVLGHLERADPGPARPPDLVVLDLNMPRRDGRRTLREIKADPRLRSLPVVILTTSDSAHDIEECLGAGARAYLVKPASFARLVEAVRMFATYATAA
jgi:CheY-like chemotaxis protein